MNEIKEAELFNKELDKMLAGEKSAQAPEGEARLDMEIASLLMGSDLSAESRVKESLKKKLVDSRESESTVSFFSWPSPQRLIMLPAGGLVAILLVAISIPKFSSMIRTSSEGQGAFKEVWGFRDADGEFSGSAPYEGGTHYQTSGGSGILGGNDKKRASELSRRGRAGKYRKLNASSGVKKVYVLPGVPKPRADARTKGAPSEDARRSGQQHYLSGVIYYQKGDFSKAKQEWTMAKKLSPESEDVVSGLERIDRLYAERPDLVKNDFNREGYDAIVENAFQRVTDHPLSTFSIDVDAASYANARRFLNSSQMPPPDAVRIEEFINYFSYDYPDPDGKHPFSITTEVAEAPWKKGHKLVHVGLQGKRIAKKNLPASNLVLLVDTSGSMQSANKLALLQAGLRLLIQEMRPQDRIAIVAYAGSAGLVLPSTSGNEKPKILNALDRLTAGGSTAGGAGIQLAYKVAAENFKKKGNNRIILATDGDFNVGTTSDGALVRMIEKERENGVFLTVLGFGDGNYQDAKMEKLADKGNGNYAYIDDILEARKVLVEEATSTLFTIAKDVKLQIEFNPARVQAYRLIGYENRMLKAEDFNDDKKDAGELGAGHSVTAIYEIVPVGVDMSLPGVDELKYQKTKPAAAASGSDELLTVKFRYKKPQGKKSKLIVNVLKDSDRSWKDSSENFRFSAAVAGFGMLLRGSQYSGNLTYKTVHAMGLKARGEDKGGYRAEFLKLVEKAELLDRRQK